MDVETAPTTEDGKSPRAERYAKDPKYAENMRARSRANYSAKHKTEFFDLATCNATLDQFGEYRETTNLRGVTSNRWVFTKTELASVLGVTVKGFYLWVNDGRFPKPTLTAVAYPIVRDYKEKKNVKVPQNVSVYSIQEVNAVIEVLGDHLSKVKYYRKDHTEERAALFEAVNLARKNACDDART